MDKIISAIFFALLGAVTVTLLTKFLKRKNKNGNFNNNMSKYNQTPYEHIKHASSGSTRNNEAKASTLAIIYRSEMDYISRCILDYPNIETGGQLFGYWTSDGTPVVCYAIGPGHKAQHHQTSFVQDWDYVKTIGEELHKQFRLQHIGEWHSHHQLGLAHPSSGDVNTMSYGVGKPGFPRLLLCIGNCTQTYTTLNAFNFHENNPHNYVEARWDIIEQFSPYRNIVDSSLKIVLIHPRTSSASYHNEVVSSTRTHWLTESIENVETMKSFVSIIKNKFTEAEVLTEMSDKGEPLISIIEYNISLRFSYDFPSVKPIIQDKNGSVLDSYDDFLWNKDLPLISRFEQFVDYIHAKGNNTVEENVYYL